VLDNQVGSASEYFGKSFDGLPKDSYLEADAVKPNTIAVERLYRSSARNPNAPVRSVWILANQKQALTLAGAMSIISVG
jgi:hypothetical protein